MGRLRATFAVAAPFDDFNHPFGFEGTDRRLLAVPLGQ
jgi:hypothetical protein